MKKIVIFLIFLAIFCYIFAYNTQKYKSLVLNSIVTTSTKQIIKNKYTEEELNNIEVFDKTVNSVVNISILSVNAHSKEDIVGVGSGFVWDDLGHIVTNFHVIRGGEGGFLITFHNDKNLYEAVVVGTSPSKDIAVLKLKNTPKKLIPLAKGESNNLVIGQKTMAIGNPFGLGHSMTIGVISSLGRTIKAVNDVDIAGIIQTDAAINPGNSGGPLIDSQGQLIGMNTAIFSQSGNSAGIGFAVPVDTINYIIPQLIKYGKEIRPVMGVILLNGQISHDYFSLLRGVMIESVIASSPAEKAKLRGVVRTRRQVFAGDVIVSLDDYVINAFSDIYSALSNYKIGDIVTIGYVRENNLYKVKIKLISNN